MDETKQCSRCSEIKPLTEFHCNKARKDGRSVYCAACTRLYNNTYYATNSHDYLVAKQYGLDRGEYAAMFVEQSGVCAICGRAETAQLGSTVKRLAVDHSHDTGEPRALLCHICNSIIGYAQDDVALLRAAIEYLEKVRPVRERPALEPARYATCGTYSGYTAHYRRHTKPCEPCQEARRAYDLARKARV